MAHLRSGLCRCFVPYGGKHQRFRMIWQFAAGRGRFEDCLHINVKAILRTGSFRPGIGESDISDIEEVMDFSTGLPPDPSEVVNLFADVFAASEGPGRGRGYRGICAGLDLGHSICGFDSVLCAAGSGAAWVCHLFADDVSSGHAPCFHIVSDGRQNRLSENWCRAGADFFWPRAFEGVGCGCGTDLW